MADKFKYKTPAEKIITATSVVAIVPSDSVELTDIPRSILIGTGGNICLVAMDDSTAVTIPVIDGQQLPIRAKLIKATGTTATNIFALY